MTVGQLIEQLQNLDMNEEPIYFALRQYRSDLALEPYEVGYIEDEEAELDLPSNSSGVYIEGSEANFTYAPRRDA